MPTFKQSKKYIALFHCWPRQELLHDDVNTCYSIRNRNIDVQPIDLKHLWNKTLKKIPILKLLCVFAKKTCSWYSNLEIIGQNMKEIQAKCMTFFFGLMYS